MQGRYFDDFKVGERFYSRGVTLTEAEIIEFGLKYDPQPFHIDVLAANDSAYAGLIASGFQTLALSFRMFLATNVLADCSLGSPGLDELRWLKPVRPGDTLRMEGKVVETRPSKSRPDRGTMRMAYVVKNQIDEDVLSFTAIHILKRREEA
jgi:acyl dehydratase